MKNKKFSLSSYSILLLILIALGVITMIIGKDRSVVEAMGSPTDVVIKARLSDIIMAPYNGMVDAISLNTFILLIGGFLGVVAATGALDKGISSLVNKMKGNELILIPVLMFMFSLGGTVYGMAEETIGFYVLVSGAMVAAGFDTLVATAVILLGSGSGVLGSTLNPFATGIAMATAVDAGLPINNTIVLVLGTILWLTSLIISIYFVMDYAKKVKYKNGSILNDLEKENMNKTFKVDMSNDSKISFKQKITLWLFAITFIIMIVSLITWEDFGITFFLGWSEFFTGLPLGSWYFGELSMLFFVMSIIIAVVNGFGEKKTIDVMIQGIADILPVVLVIVIARGASSIMASTQLDKYVLNNAAAMMDGLKAIIFTPMSYIFYILVSFLIPSTSGLASVSIGIMGGLAKNIGFSVEVMIMIFAAGSGIVNFMTPTSGVVMGGLAISKVEYSTWLKFIGKILLVIFIVDTIILTIAMMVV